MAKTKESKNQREVKTVGRQTAIVAARMLAEPDMSALDGHGRVAVTRVWLGVNEHAALYDRRQREAAGRLVTDADRELLGHLDDTEHPDLMAEARRRNAEIARDMEEALAPTLTEQVERTWPSLAVSDIEALAGANQWTTYQMAALMAACGEE